MNEIWQEVKGYEVTYKVSNLGNVKSLARKKVKNDRILIPFINSNGYYSVKLTQDGVCKTHKIHQLVAIAFLGHSQCGYKKIVDHIDNNQLNNRADNLQLISQRDNSTKDKINNHSKFSGVYKDRSGKKYYSTIKINSKSVYLGSFNCETSAFIAYSRAKKLENAKL
jgi:hypothetical protein